MRNRIEGDGFQSPRDARVRAGAAAEEQMRFYLHREFAREREIRVLNNLRLQDGEQPEHSGAPGVCQIDHLILHRWGAFVIESKSVYDEVSVRDDGEGGDEWTRRYRDREHAFASPIQQARRQGEFLRLLLNRHRETLLDRTAAGLRTIRKILSGSEHRGFRNLPIQIIVAISDNGKINRLGGWEPPHKPFRTFVCKADLAPQRVREEWKEHRKQAGMLSTAWSEYGMWSMGREELDRVVEFLEARRMSQGEPTAPVRSPGADVNVIDPLVSTPLTSSPSSTVLGKCGRCASTELTAVWTKYGYCWSCRECRKQTKMPKRCGACGAADDHGKVVRIRKDGPHYFRACAACGIEERIWSATT